MENSNEQTADVTGCDVWGCDQIAVANDEPLTSVAYAERMVCRWHRANPFAEVRRLRAFAAEVQGVRNMVERDANLDPEGDQWATGNRVACRSILKELDGALGMLERP